MRPPRSTPISFAVSLLLAGLLSTPTTSVANVLMLGPSKDNTMYQEDGSLSNGAGDYIFAGNTKDGIGFARRALVEFNIAGSIPAGSTINSVTLTVFVSRSRTENENGSLHKVLAAWGEGTSNASGEEGAGTSAATGDATWTHRFYSTTTWSTSGGNYNATASATAVIGGQNNFYSWSSAGMASDVQDWLDNPGNNFGWIIIGNETDTSVAKQFPSRTNPTTARRPELTIDFTPPAPTGACCATEGTCTIVLDPGGSCTGTYQGSGTICDPNPCPQPTGACCLPNATATCNEVTEESCDTAGGTFEGDLTTCSPNPCPVVLRPYLDSLPIPAPATPVSGSSGGTATYNIAMREIEQQLHAELANPTRLWGYGSGPTGASFPGPTIEAFTDQPVTVNWINDIRDFDTGLNRTSHYLNVDTCPHGADDQSVRTVVHLHGGHVPAEFDGYPEDTFLPGNQKTYVYPNKQFASTLWFHDHALGITRLNVYMGLVAFYIIRDPVEQALNLPSGEFEIPIAIQDRTFNPDATLQYPSAWQDNFFGDTFVVNGKAWPYLNVKKGKYRFRFLNGCNSRTIRLSLSNGASFQVIGQEGGLLSAPVTVTEITLGPAERADTIIDFAPYATGTEIILNNDAPAPFPGTPGVGVIPNVMKFVVQDQAGDTDAVPGTLRTLEVLDENDAVISRTFELKKGPSDPCAPFEWEVVTTQGLNGTETGHKWVDITEFPELDTTEIWSFVNRSGITHPMHMHLVFFQVLDRQAFVEEGGLVVPIGAPVAPPAHEAGWKDTVQVGPNEIVRVIARFDDYTGKYPYHCHILEHEDHEMMRQFQTVQCGNAVLEPGEECDDGNKSSADTCSAGCDLQQALWLTGEAEGGGMVQITVDGELISVMTSAGQTAAQVVAALANGINNDPELQTAGVTAFASGDSLFTTGSITNVTITDAGIQQGVVPALSLAGLAAFGMILALLAIAFRARRKGVPA